MLENPDKTELIDSFYKDLEFGTGGLRGIMGAGTNRMNIYTVGAATQGLSNYLNKCFAGKKDISVVVGYDDGRLGLSRNDQFIRPAMMPRYDCDEETDPEGRVPDADDDNFFD